MDIEFKSEISVELINKMGDDKTVAYAAWIASQAYPPEEPLPEKIAGLINYLMAHRHGTPFEHGAMTFRVHAPIFVWREWHRHRVGFSYNEESARYKKLDPVFWVPAKERPLCPISGFKSARPQFGLATDSEYDEFCRCLKHQYRMAYEAYDHLVTVNFAKEAARAVLPVGIYSACWITCNPRSLMHFLSLRTHDDAAKFVSYPQYEIEQAARACEAIFAQGWPLTHEAWTKNGRVAP